MSPPAAAAKAMFSDDESGSDSGSDTSGSSSGSDDTAKRRASKPNSNVVGKAGDVLTINKKFAERFEHNKRREETHRLQEKVKREYILRPGDVGDSESDSETSSSESDEGDVPVKFDAQFAEALLKIKQKDPAIYREDAELFSSDDDDDDDDDAKEKKKKKRAPKKETLREVTARQLLEGGAEAYEREDAEAEARRVQASGRSYVEEQEDLKNAFKTAAGLDGKKASASAERTSSGSESDSDSDSDGLRVKRRAISGFSDSDGDAEEEDEKKRAATLAKTKLGAFFRADGAEGEEDKNEAFLRDFLLNEKWRDPEDGGEDGKSGFTYGRNRKDDRSHARDGSGSEDGDSEEDARAFEEAERFEQKYNFRFEEPDGGVIQSHARTIEGTVRKEKTSRRDARNARNERKLSEKERLRAEVRRLKNLKREEIRAKMAQIAAVGGLAGAEAVAAADLNSEFDPEKHDAAMAAMYGEQYYEGVLVDEEGEELVKPEFGDLDEEVNALLGAATETEGGAADESEKFKKVREAMLARSANGTFEGDAGDDIDDDDDDEDDDDDDGGVYDAGAEDEDDDDIPAKGETHANGVTSARAGSEPDSQTGNKFSKRAAKRWKKELLAKMDEYYALDAEDFIDDVPCRFKYKEVAPSMYGLTTKEILSMSDKQLTQIVPLKKLAPYRHDADNATAPKEKMRSQRMAREFLTEAAKRGGKRKDGRKDGKKMTARERKGKGKKEGVPGGGVDDADPEAAAAAAAADRVASYGARAWGKYNIDKKGKKKAISNGTSAADGDAAGKEATRKDDGDMDKKRKADDRLSVDDSAPAAAIKPGTGKNAKKNLKKRQKRNELEKAKAAGML